MARVVPADLYTRPLPYGLDDEKSVPDRFVTTNRRDFIERDAAEAHLARGQPVDFSNRPLPYSLDEGADSLDRFVTTNRRQFVPRAEHEAQPARRENADFTTNRPVPYAFDVNHDSSDRYETSNERQFQPGAFDLKEARMPRSQQANYYGRPLPYASAPEADNAEKWVSTTKRQFVPRDLAEARPARRVTHDQEYNVVTFEPVHTFSAPDPHPRGRTVALGISRPQGISMVPASRQTERHMVQYVQNFHPNPLTGHAYGSAELMRDDVMRHSVVHDPADKFTQPVTESHAYGWQWHEGHDGFHRVQPAFGAGVDGASPPRAKDPYFGRKASYITKRQESLLKARGGNRL